jgi:hypothetical protein
MKNMAMAVGIAALVSCLGNLALKPPRPFVESDL